MPAPWGVTASGFNPMRLDDVKSLLEADFRTIFGQNTRLDARTVNGQFIGVFSELVSDVWAEAEKVYAAAYPAGAAGTGLDDLVGLAGIDRPEATYSTVTLTLGGVNGTVITEGSESQIGEDGTIWIHLAEATIASGTATVEARAEVTGPITGLAGTITSIATPITGWNTVTNAADAVVGQDAGTDASLREALITLMRAPGDALEAVTAALIRVEDVTEAIVVENETSFTDVDGRPPHSFEAVVLGGDEQDIVDTIWENQPSGVSSHGSITGTVVDAAGDDQTVKFSRPTNRPIYIIVDYRVLPGADADIETQIRDRILELGSAFLIGRDVIPFADFIQNIEVPKLKTLSLRVGLASNPALTDPIEIPRTHRATFDSTRIAFNRQT